MAIHVIQIYEFSMEFRDNLSTLLRIKVMKMDGDFIVLLIGIWRGVSNMVRSHCVINDNWKIFLIVKDFYGKNFEFLVVPGSGVLIERKKCDKNRSQDRNIENCKGLKI